MRGEERFVFIGWLDWRVFICVMGSFNVLLIMISGLFVSFIMVGLKWWIILWDLLDMFMWFYRCSFLYCDCKIIEDILINFVVGCFGIFIVGE